MYLLLGEEVLLREEFLSRLLAALMPPAMDVLNLDIVLGSETSGADLMIRCRTTPAFAPRRVVVLKETDRLHKEVWDAVLSYLEDPSSTTCLICVAEKMDRQHLGLQRITRAGKVLRFVLPKDQEERQRWCQRWMRERARQHGKILTPEAELLLINLQGPDLLRLSQEVDKLCLFVGERQRIDLETVEALVGAGRVHGIFELTRAVSLRDLGGALVALRNLLERGEEPLGILGMVARQLRLLLRAKELLAHSHSPAEMSRLLGIPRPFLSEILEGAQGSSLPQLERGLLRLLDLDRELKSGGRGRSVHLELAIIDLCSWALNRLGAEAS